MIRRDIEFASRLGARVLVLHYSAFAHPDRLIVDASGRPLPALTVDRDLREWAPMLGSIRTQLADYVSVASGLGVSLALETDVNNSHRLLDFIAGSAPDRCGICFDTGHAQIDSDALALAEMLAPRVICAHIHDNQGAADEHLLPFEGVIDWPGVVSALKQGGYRGWFTYELSAEALTDVRNVLPRLSSALARLWRDTPVSRSPSP